MNYTVSAKLRQDLTPEQRAAAIAKIEDLQRKFSIIRIDEETYCKAGSHEQQSDFGAVTFFFCVLKRMKEVFEKLEYHDLLEGKSIIIKPS